MAPAMTGPQAAAAEIAKITAMMTHDHQSLSEDCAAVATLAFLRASARRTFATAILLGMTRLMVGAGDGSEWVLWLFSYAAWR